MKSIELRGKKIFYEGQEYFWLAVERGEWEPYSFDILDKHLETGKTFVDLGAWNGVLSIYAKNLGSNVASCEPDEKAYSLLLRNIQLNEIHYPDIFFIQTAINDYNGNCVIQSNDFGNSTSNIMGFGSQLAITKCMTLSTLLLSTLLRPYDVSLIKMDIEGAEVKVIIESAEWLAKNKPKMYISFHPDWFKDREKDVAAIIEVMFPIYHVYGVIYEKKEYTERDFRAAMYTPHDHSFLFIAK